VFEYSRGSTSSRSFARACEEEVVFMALSADNPPHFTTIGEFISSLSGQVQSVCTDVLPVCHTAKLIWQKLFAVDGCKIRSDCSRERRGAARHGTKAQLRKQALKIKEFVLHQSSYLLRG
jgi:transposase